MTIWKRLLTYARSDARKEPGMGLDTVELVMRVEDDFGIELPDRMLDHVLTVGDLRRIVCGRLQTQSRACCWSQSTFYVVRRAIMDVVGIPREHVRSKTDLESLLPTHARDAYWRRLTAASGLHWPRLGIARWFLAAMVLAAASPALNLPLVLRDDRWVTIYFSGWIIFSFAVIGVGAYLGSKPGPWHERLPQDCRTVGDLAKLLVVLNPRRVPTDEVVWSQLRGLIAEWSGRPANDIELTTSFATLG